MLCYCVSQRCGYDGFNSHCLLRHGAFLDTACADVVEKKYAYFVSAYQLIGTIRTLHGDTYTVGIGICCQHQVSACLFGKIQSQFQSGKDLRIGIAAGGEITVGIFLFRNDGHVGNTDVFQYLSNRNETGTVQRAVNQLQTGTLAKTRTNLTGFDSIVQSTFAVITNETDQPLLYAFCKGHIFGTCQNICFLDLGIYDGCRIISHLTTIRTICFISIVLSRIVRSCDHYTSIAVVVACSKGQCRNRHQCIINTNVNAIGSQYTGSVFGKYITL